MANRRRRMRFHADARSVCLLGARYPLASLLSSLDVRRYHYAGYSQKLMGVFHRVLSRRVVDLRKSLCHHLLPQRIATAFSMGSHGPFGAGRFAYRSTSMVFKSACCHWVRLGVLSGSNTISPRRGQVSGYVRPHHRILRSGHGFVPAPLSQPLSSNVAPTFALIAPGQVGSPGWLPETPCCRQIKFGHCPDARSRRRHANSI